MILTYIVLSFFYFTAASSFSNIGKGAPRRHPFCRPNHQQQCQDQAQGGHSLSSIAAIPPAIPNVGIFVSNTCITSRTSSIPQNRHNNRFLVGRRRRGVNVFGSHHDQEEGEAINNIDGPGVSNLSPMRSFESDINTVLNTLTVDEDQTIFPRIFAKSPLTITRVWDLDLWARSTSRARYIRFLGNMFFSRLFKRILPQLLCFIAWSVICVSVITNRMKTVTTHFVPLASLSLVSTFIAFLITLRTNQSLNRLGEARNLWGRLFITSRDTAQLLSTYVYEKDKLLGLKAVRYLSLFSWLVKDRLRDTNRKEIVETMIPGSYYTNGHVDGVDDLEVKFSSNHDSRTIDESLAYLSSHRKRPAAIIARIRQIVAELADRNMLPYAPHQQLEQNLNEMNYILGMCERLKGSPIPPVYTSHTSRLLVFYLVFLPLALNGSAQKKVTTVIVTATVSYTLLGLDEISHVLEQPFRLMPLHELSRNIMMDVADAFVCRPPSLKVGSESGLKVDGNKNENENGGRINVPMYWR